jgi:hypothetical protein
MRAALATIILGFTLWHVVGTIAQNLGSVLK